MPILAGHLPAELRRYNTSDAFVGALVGEVIGSTARQDLIEERLATAEAFDEIGRRWAGPAGRQAALSLSLSRHDVVWATFTGAGAASPGPNAEDIADSLALPPGGKSLLEIRYPRDAVRNHRFPTVADADGFHLFRPAPEVLPDPAAPRTLCGWTHPARGAPAQPEIVHDNATLAVLTVPPRYVGRIS